MAITPTTTALARKLRIGKFVAASHAAIVSASVETPGGVAIHAYTRSR